jgi:hypothetical protein
MFHKIRESIRVTYENRLKNKLIKRRSQEHEAFNFRSLVVTWSLKLLSGLEDKNILVDFHLAFWPAFDRWRLGNITGHSH